MKSVAVFLVLCGVLVVSYKASISHNRALFRTSQLSGRSAVRRLSQDPTGDQIELQTFEATNEGEGSAATFDLAHNLTVEGQPALQQIYQGRLQQLLASSEELVRWEISDARQRSCQACGPLQEGSQVAVVGNGPISPEQRARIAALGCVVRFNRVNTLDRASQERTDVWFIRGAGVRWHAPKVGLEEGVDPGVIVLANEFWRELSPRQQAILAEGGAGGAAHMGDSDADADYSGSDAGFGSQQEGGRDGDEGVEQEAGAVQRGELKGWAPSRRYRRVPWTAFAAAFAAERAAAAGEAWRWDRLLPLELTPLNQEWKRLMEELGFTRRTLPSTGLIGILSMLDCLPPGASMHVYGFNWSPAHWEGHNMEVEASLLRMLSTWDKAKQGRRVVLHPTPCQDCLRPEKP